MNLEIRRTVYMYQKLEKTQVGDIIEFELKTGEKVEAMKMTLDGIWCFVDCLEDECDMHDMDKALERVVEEFPDEIRQMLRPFDDGKLLRLPTEKEVFGDNRVGKPEPDDVVQWEPMKLRRNRIASQGLNGDCEWWWTSTQHKKDASCFAAVGNYGLCAYSGASNSYGVRPAFRF